jgi:hypothetical protein
MFIFFVLSFLSVLMVFFVLAISFLLIILFSLLCFSPSGLLSRSLSFLSVLSLYSFILTPELPRGLTARQITSSIIQTLA